MENLKKGDVIYFKKDLYFRLTTPTKVTVTRTKLTPAGTEIFFGEYNYLGRTNKIDGFSRYAYKSEREAYEASIAKAKALIEEYQSELEQL